MIVGTCKVYFRAPWVTSLKDKRMILKSIISKVKNKFNVSIAEIEMQDVHHNGAIGFACVTTNIHHADQIIQNVINFIENNIEGEVYDIKIEII
ncbi:DUF503 domain-containing protein [Defluviitalea phaphyphila]|uniref:DUF503 domain-containing protein n=1 Tax=Defluviitalea phaphyphila TaxID=1473580 RepID=UPI000731D076|nr:DUF503 domain-containing protein [Defluviitalea phaphyphila]